MNVGIIFLVVIGVVILGQLLVQGNERRREHAALTRRLDRIAGKGN